MRCFNLLTRNIYLFTSVSNCLNNLFNFEIYLVFSYLILSSHFDETFFF